MTVYEALSLMIAFGALVAVICLSKKESLLDKKKPPTCGTRLPFTLIRFEGEPAFPKTGCLYVYIISN